MYDGRIFVDTKMVMESNLYTLLREGNIVNFNAVSLVRMEN